MNIIDTRNSLNLGPLNSFSELLLHKNGIFFQNLISVEENCELVVELLKNTDMTEIASEIADVFVTQHHTINAFGIKHAFQYDFETYRKNKIGTKKLCIYLSQLSKEIVKNLNRDQFNIDEISKYSALTTVGMLQYIQRNKIVDAVKLEIARKLARTIERNDLDNYSPAQQKKKNWDEIFLLMAYAMASGSHCVSHQVGALWVVDKRIVSTGINGTAEGTCNCDDIFPPKTDPSFDRKAHHDFSLKYEMHAEMNGVNFAAKRGIGVPLQGSTLYCTTQPCDQCLKNIISIEPRKIIYAEAYDLAGYNRDTQETLERKNIEIIHQPLFNTAKSYVFIQNAMVKSQK